MRKIKYRYILEKGSRKFICPECHKKTFVRFVDVTDNKYLPDEYGRCDRESKCGYYKIPQADQKNLFHRSNKVSKKITKPGAYYLPFSVVNATLGNYGENVFVQNLLSHIAYPVTMEMAIEIVEAYNIGTVVRGYLSGGMTIPFINTKGEVCAIQVKTFDKDNHTLKTNFWHSIYANELKSRGTVQPQWLIDYYKNEKIINCLFGEHLLNRYPHNPIALVEAPKTALYASLYFGLPQSKSDLLWLAVFNKSSLSYDKIKVLRDRKIVLFPDLNAYEDWSKKAKRFKSYFPNIRISVSEYLEYNAEPSDKAKGLDLGDYLIKYDWRHFRNKVQSSVSQEEPDVSEAINTKAFIDSENRLYIKMSINNDYTQYSNVDVFLKRTSLPKMVSPDDFVRLDVVEVDYENLISCGL